MSGFIVGEINESLGVSNDKSGESVTKVVSFEDTLETSAFTGKSYG